MNISQSELLGRLDSINAEFRRLEVAPGIEILVTSHGGRIHGPFFNGIDAAGWISPAFASDEALAEFHRSANWNIGGERLWLSPELGFFVGDRTRFWETFSVPADIDPGHHRLAANGIHVAVTQEIASRDAAGPSINVRRRIDPLSLPLQVGQDGVRLAGYRQVIDISHDGVRPVVPWIIRQVAPGGIAVVPVDAGTVAVGMFGEPPVEMMAETSGAIRIPITSDRMFKIAMTAASSRGLIGHIHPQGSDAVFHFFRFSHDRQGEYHDEPPDRPGLNGFSSFVFQDDGSLGSYGELEIVGLDLGVGTDGLRHGHLAIDTIVAFGSADGVNSIASQLMRVRPGI